MYSIGMGKDGHKYTFYNGEYQIALVEKENTVTDMKDTYDIYATEEKYIEICTLYCIQLDILAFGNFGKFPVKSKETNTTITLNKELKHKFDPGFKSRCS